MQQRSTPIQEPHPWGFDGCSRPHLMPGRSETFVIEKGPPLLRNTHCYHCSPAVGRKLHRAHCVRGTLCTEVGMGHLYNIMVMPFTTILPPPPPL